MIGIYKKIRENAIHKNEVYLMDDMKIQSEILVSSYTQDGVRFL